MALFNRDAEVEALAEEVRRLTKAKTKTEAVRRPLQEQLARAKALADALGPGARDFDMKALPTKSGARTHVHRRLRQSFECTPALQRQ